MNSRIRFIVFSFIGLTILVSSCTKKDDLYKGVGKEEQTLFDENVVLPSGFNWESAKAMDVRIAVDDQYNGRYFYRVELYDADPKLATANLLGAGVAKSGQDYVDKIMVPTALQYVYVKRTSPVGIASITMLETANNAAPGTAKTASAAFGTMSSTTSALSKANTSATVLNVQEVTEPTVPATYLPLSNGHNYDWTSVNNSSKVFVIEEGVTYTEDFNFLNSISGIKIYVKGTWNRSSITIGKTSEVYVLNGGKLNLTDLSQNSSGFLENYGTTTISNNFNGTTQTDYKNYGSLTVGNELNIHSGGTFYNAGTIHVKDLKPNTSTSFTNEGVLTVTGTLAIPDAGSFLNTGTASVKTLTANTGTGLIRNEGSLTVQAGDVTNATIEAACHTSFGSLATNGAKIYVTTGALLDIENLDAGGTQFNLASSSILDVTTLAKFNSNTNTITGTGSSKALARLKKVESLEATKGGIIYSGNVEIACSDYTPNKQYNIYYTLTDPAYIVGYDKSTVEIAATECNAGGNNDAGAGTDPKDQTVKEVSLGTYSYAFEDNWPSFGDYDMNDFVVDMDITKFQNTDNKATKVVLKANLRSVGATKRLAAAVQLDGVLAGNVKSVTYSKQDIVGENFTLGSNGVENGQTYAVMPICDDAHQAFGLSEVAFISTKSGQFSPVEVIITVEFNSPVTNFTYDKLNIFIVTSGYKSTRTEVHLPNYSGTDKLNSSIVATGVDSGQLFSTGHPFISGERYPWAICVPVSFEYPDEWKKITGVYPYFTDWAISGGTVHTDWYIK